MNLPILFISMNRAALNTLGFESDITNPLELKKRYRQLLFQYHPDVCTDKNATQKVIEVINAYQTLQANVTTQELFMLIDIEEVKIAIPIDTMVEFVSTQDTIIRNIFLFTAANYHNQIYQVHSIDGQNICASVCQGWLLLLKAFSLKQTSLKIAFFFKELPSQIRFVSQESKHKNQSHYILADQVEYFVPSILL